MPLGVLFQLPCGAGSGSLARRGFWGREVAAVVPQEHRGGILHGGGGGGGQWAEERWSREKGFVPLSRTERSPQELLSAKRSPRRKERGRESRRRCGISAGPGWVCRAPRPAKDTSTSLLCPALNISSRLWLGCPHGPLTSTLPTEPRRSHRPCSTTPLVKGGRHKGKHDKKIGKSGEGLRINAQARLPGKMLKALAMVIEPSLGIFVFPALFDGQKS